jgi:hypothetical protein
MDGDHVQVGGIEDKTDAIREGARRVALLAQDRLREAIEALLDGRFSAAYAACEAAQAKLGTLASAEGALASMIDPQIKVVRPRELEEGWDLIGQGEVLSVKVRAESSSHFELVKVRVRDESGQEQELSYPPTRDLLVRLPEVTP